MNDNALATQEQLQEPDIRDIGELVPRASLAVTPAQARVESVARVMDAAMNRASTLTLTPEENAALEADFPDEAFKPGAAGKENLIYIEHAFLRDRFNAVIGRGQWALLRTRPQWAEEFRTPKGVEAVRIYADCALLVRGCMVAEAIGEMVYYKNNDSQNYGDAAEGAITAAFRRCAKHFGVGLQAWKKDFCDGWWQRKRGHAPTQQSSPKPFSQRMPEVKPITTTLAPAPTPAVSFKNASERKARLDAFLLKCKLKLVSDLERGDPQQAVEFMQKAGHLMPNEAAISEANELTIFPSVRHEPASNETDGEWWHLVGEAVAKDAQAIKRAYASFQNGEQLEGATISHEAEPAPLVPVIPDGAKEMAGFVKLVNKKPTAKGGTKYGILIVQDLQDREGGEWLNTFDDKDGVEAERLKGQEVAVAYTEGQYGKDLCKHAIREVR